METLSSTKRGLSAQGRRREPHSRFFGEGQRKKEVKKEKEGPLRWGKKIQKKRRRPLLPSSSLSSPLRHEVGDS